LNIDNKERSNPFPWNGQFSPQLVEVMLQTYAGPRSFILDPFLGSGTVLHEAGRMHHPAFGAEINPAAYKMAQVYRFINVGRPGRQEVVEEVDAVIQEACPGLNPLFSRSTALPGPGELRQALVAGRARLAPPFALPLLETLIVLLNYGTASLTSDQVGVTWSKLRASVLALPYSDLPIDLANCDARALPLTDGVADVVITSPPYINVFNYHQQYRGSVEALGWDLLAVAKSEIGSNRKHRGNRFLTVAQYCLDMVDALFEFRRVCKQDARIIMVVGRESRVRKTSFYNGEIVARLAVRCANFRLEARQERVFQNKFGEMIYEDILHFRPAPVLATAESPLEVAREALGDALARAPEESVSDLKEAISRLADVRMSPTYSPSQAQRSQVSPATGR
jgi:hypothetical protein